MRPSILALTIALAVSGGDRARATTTDLVLLRNPARGICLGARSGAEVRAVECASSEAVARLRVRVEGHGAYVFRFDDSNTCLTLVGRGALARHPCTNDPGQRFRPFALDGGALVLVTLAFTCVEARPGAPVNAASCDGSEAQAFVIEFVDDDGITTPGAARSTHSSEWSRASPQFPWSAQIMRIFSLTTVRARLILLRESPTEPKMPMIMNTKIASRMFGAVTFGIGAIWRQYGRLTGSRNPAPIFASSFHMALRSLEAIISPATGAHFRDSGLGLLEKSPQVASMRTNSARREFSSGVTSWSTSTTVRAQRTSCSRSWGLRI